MISKIKISNGLKEAAKFAALLSLMLAVVNILGAHNMTFAASAGDVIGADDELFQTTSGGSLRTFIQTIINFVLGFLGLVAVGFLIYGGILTVTAGSEDGLEKSKGVIKNAVIGIIVIVISYALINTVINGLATGTEAV